MGLRLAMLLVLTIVPWVSGQSDIRRDAVVRAVEEVMPCVVNVSAETLAEAPGPMAQLYRDFFGPGWGRSTAPSLGSGVIIEETGYVITNFHVVERANHIRVKLWDGREYEAKPLVGARKTDVALLKLMAKGNERFRAINFAPNDDLLLGETVVALGNPFGLGGSVSRGILSSRSRRPPRDNQPLDIEDWLQTDAAINPGNSGGPLINLRAELIGINVAVLADGQGIGFAIPVRRVTEALEDLFTPETIKSYWFGARFSTGTNGLHAVRVEAGSPAESAGLKVGDKVLRVNDKAPRNSVELNREIIAAAGAREAQLLVARQNERRNISVRLIPEKEVFNENLIRLKLGLAVKKLDEQSASQFGAGGGEGLLVTGVEPDSPAARADFQKGYLIRAVEGRPVEEVTDAARILHGKKKGEKVALELVVPRLRGRVVQLYSAAAELRVR